MKERKCLPVFIYINTYFNYITIDQIGIKFYQESLSISCTGFSNYIDIILKCKEIVEWTEQWDVLTKENISHKDCRLCNNHW